MFPNEEAAKIAVQTVKDYKAETGSKIEVIFAAMSSDELIKRQKIDTHKFVSVYFHSLLWDFTFLHHLRRLHSRPLWR